MVGSDAGSYVISVAGGLSSFRCARFSSFILRFSMRFISFWRFWNVVVISLLTAECGAGPGPCRPAHPWKRKTTSEVREAAAPTHGNLRSRNDRVLLFQCCGDR